MSRLGMDRPDWRKPRFVGWLLAAGLVGVACSSAGSVTPSPSPSATDVESAAPTPSKGPAAAQVTLSGDPSLAALPDSVSIQCDYPTLGGPVIVLTKRTSLAGLAVRVTISQTLVTVRYSLGSGKTYTERDFTGAGVTDFDASAGAQVDAPLDVLANATPTGALGSIVSIQASVDCGDQQPGTSTLTLTGTTPVGQLANVTLNPVRVECDLGAQGNAVSIVGVAMVASVPTLFAISVDPKGAFSVTQTPQTGQSSTYTAKATGAVTVSAGGVHIAAGASPTPVVTAGASPHKLTVSGDAICGTTVVN